MSAQTDFRQLLTGGEQANQASAWDWMVGNSATLQGRVSPSGQTWDGVESDEIEVTGGVMKLKAGSAAVTAYPFLVSPTNLLTIGAELQFVAAGGATHDASAVLIISEGVDLSNDAFLHFVISALGYVQLDWYAAGLNGGVTATTGPLVGTVTLSDRMTVQGLVSGPANNATATWVSPIGSVQLTGLNLPGNMTTAIWEFTNNGATLKNSLQYFKVWANPTLALMFPLTVQPSSKILSNLSSKSAVTLSGVTLDTSPAINMSGGFRATTHASWVGGIEFKILAGTTGSTMGFAADGEFYWGMPANNNGLTFYNGARNTQLFKFLNNGDLECSVTGAGFVMDSPNGSRWRLTVSNAGVVGATAL